MLKTKPITIVNDESEFFFCITEYLHKDGSYVKPNEWKKRYHTPLYNDDCISNYIISCPKCNALSNVMDFHFKNTHKRVRETVEIEGAVEGVCPKCGETLHGTGCFDPIHQIPSSLEGKELMYLRAREQLFGGKVKYWPMQGNKIAFELETVGLSGIANQGKYFIKRHCRYHRLVFNLETGMSYVLPPRDSKGNKVKDVGCTDHIVNMSFKCNHVWPTIGREQEEAIVNVLRKTMVTDSVWEDETRSLMDMARFNFLKCFKPNDVRDILKVTRKYYHCNKTWSHDITFMKKCVRNQDYTLLPKYMQKKSIKKRLSKRMILYTVYKWLWKIGVKDVNIMNSFVDELGQSAPDVVVKVTSSWGEASKINCMKWLIKNRDVASLKAILKDMLKEAEHTWSSTFDDLANMRDSVIAAGMDITNRGSLKELHDEMTHAYNQVRYGNKTIEYSDKEKALEELVEGFQFELAKDTDTLYDIGKEMGICVGSYGEDAVRKYCTIITMIHEGKHVVCMELHKKGKTFTVTQLKGKFNSVIKDVEPFEIWAKAHDIDFKDCFDYQTAVDGSKEYFYCPEHDYHVENPRFRENNPIPFPEDDLGFLGF